MMVGWERKQLGEICENLDSKRVPITKSKRLSGSIPYYGASGVVDHVADYLFDEDLLLVSEDGANLLARTYSIAFSIFGKTWVNNHAHVLRFENMDSQRFIEYYLNSISLDPYVSGMAQPKLNQKSLNSIPVPLPPIPEQKRIVAILDEAFAEIDAAVANTEKNLANARELFESYLNGVFTRKGDGWVEKKLSSFMDISHGFAFKGHDFKASSNVTKPIVLTPGNYSEYGELYFTEKNTKRFTGELPKNYQFEVGELTVVMTDLSSKMKILGKPAFIDQSNTLHNQRIGRVIFKGSEVLPRLVYYYLRSQSAAEKIKKTSTGTMVRHTAPKRILALNITFPPTETEQVKIVSVLDDLAAKTQHLESIYQQKLTALTELKQSILQKAFAGELTTLPKETLKEAVA